MLAALAQGLGNGLALVIAGIPRFIGFLAILIVGFIVAKALQRVFDRVLERIGFDRWVERGGVARALSGSKYDASDLLSAVVYYTVMLFVLQAAFGVFGPNPVSTLLTAVVAYLPRLFVAGVIVIVGSAVAAAVRDIVDAAIGGLSYGRILGTAAAFAIVAIAVFAAFDQLRIAPAITTGLFYATLAAVAGAFIVAVGGGGIQTMSRYWERAAGRIEAEPPRMMMAEGEGVGAQERVQERAQERMQQAREAMQTQQPGAPSRQQAQKSSKQGAHAKPTARESDNAPNQPTKR